MVSPCAPPHLSQDRRSLGRSAAANRAEQPPHNISSSSSYSPNIQNIAVALHSPPFTQTQWHLLHPVSCALQPAASAHPPSAPPSSPQPQHPDETPRQN